LASEFLFCAQLEFPVPETLPSRLLYALSVLLFLAAIVVPYEWVAGPVNRVRFMLMVPCCLWSVLIWTDGFRRIERQRKGLCGECGYDLRGSRDRCPECGTLLVNRLQRTDGLGKTRRK
jgi:hypothetical protein